MKETKEYRLATTVEGRTRYAPKGDWPKAYKALVDAEENRKMRLDIFSENTVAYRRTLEATFKIETREVTEWSEIKVKV